MVDIIKELDDLRNEVKAIKELLLDVTELASRHIGSSLEIAEQVDKMLKNG